MKNLKKYKRTTTIYILIRSKRTRLRFNTIFKNSFCIQNMHKLQKRFLKWIKINKIVDNDDIYDDTYDKRIILKVCKFLK